jgi:hypothetical protein
MKWMAFDDGASIGQRGSENGVILRDDEHPFGARITLEEDGSNAPFAITCGIYGWMFHTRFLGTQQEAEAEYEQMKDAFHAILNLIPLEADPNAREKMVQVSDAISRFVEQYP